MNTEWRMFARATEPDLFALTAALVLLMPAAAGGALGYQFYGGNVYLNYGSWGGVDLVAVQNAVTACAAKTYRTDAKGLVDSIDVYLKAAFLVALDEINTIRTATGTLPIGAARSATQFWNAIKTKVDTL